MCRSTSTKRASVASNWSLGSQWLGWDWNANATFLDPQNRSGGVNDGNELPRRAQRMFNLELDRRSSVFRWRQRARRRPTL